LRVELEAMLEAMIEAMLEACLKRYLKRYLESTPIHVLAIVLYDFLPIVNLIFY
jgi:hypothetical protein